jgi:8-oxo-dGTP diphosphatase
MPATDQKVDKSRYCVIPRVLIFIFRGDEILLIRGSTEKRIWAEKYNGLGGHVEQGESLIAAARRELLEEANLVCENLALAGTLIVDIGNTPGIGVFIFVGRITSKKIRSSREGELVWVVPDQIVDLPVVEDLPVLLERIIRIKPGDPPFSARSSYDSDEHLVVVFDDDR